MFAETVSCPVTRGKVVAMTEHTVVIVGGTR